MDVLQLIGRKNNLFSHDIEQQEVLLQEIIRGSKFLIIGGAGSSESNLT